jgi:hypothetical protein
MDPEAPAAKFTRDSFGCGLSRWRSSKLFQKGEPVGEAPRLHPPSTNCCHSKIWTSTRDHTDDTTLLRATGSSFRHIVRSDHGKANRKARAVHLGQPTIQSATSVRVMIGLAAQKTLSTPRPLCSGMILLPFFPMEFLLYRVMGCYAAKAHREIVELSVSLHGMI